MPDQWITKYSYVSLITVQHYFAWSLKSNVNRSSSISTVFKRVGNKFIQHQRNNMKLDISQKCIMYDFARNMHIFVSLSLAHTRFVSAIGIDNELVIRHVSHVWHMSFVHIVWMIDFDLTHSFWEEEKPTPRLNIKWNNNNNNNPAESLMTQRKMMSVDEFNQE